MLVDTRKQLSTLARGRWATEVVRRQCLHRVWVLTRTRAKPNWLFQKRCQHRILKKGGELPSAAFLTVTWFSDATS